MNRCLFAILATAMALSTFGPASAAEKTLTVGAAVFPQTLMSGQSPFSALSLMRQTDEPLVTRDNAGNIVPALAERWETIDDATWRFHLRQGVKFHDGADFTAADVAFTIGRALDPKTAYGLLGRINQIAGTSIVDDHTIDIRTKGPFPTLLRGLADVVIEPKHYYDQAGPQAVARHPIGTGPFVFQRFTPGDRYELTANKQYWGGAPKVDRLVIREIPEGATRVASLVAGETQIVEEVPIDLIGQVNASDAAHLEEINTTAGLILTFDTRKPPFDNPKVREALDYAIDKPTLLKTVLAGHGELLSGQLLTSASFGQDPTITARAFNPDKARQMLKDAGYDFGTPVPITTLSGKYVSDVEVCNAIAGMLNNVGVEATVNVVEGSVWTQMFVSNNLGPMNMIAWYSLGDADLATIWFSKASGRNYWNNAEYESLFQAARTTNDQSKRTQDYHRMMAIMHDENPAIFLFGLPSLYGVGNKVTGFGAASDKIFRLNQAEVK